MVVGEVGEAITSVSGESVSRRPAAASATNSASYSRSTSTTSFARTVPEYVITPKGTRADLPVAE